MPSSPPSTASPTHSEAWLAAIASAERKRRRDPSDAADYLRHLHDVLHGHGRARWNEPPAFPPPPPRWEHHGRHPAQRCDAFDPYAHQPQYAHDATHIGASSGDEALVDTIATTSMPRLAVSSSADAAADRNPYSIFGAGDDDGSDDSSDDDEISDEDIVYHATTQTPNNNNHVNEAWADEQRMSTRRILLRVHCALAEIHSQRAVACSKSRQWIAGADEFEVAFRTILSGQELLDEEHAYIAQIVEVLDGGTAHGGNANANASLEREIRQRKEGIAKDSEVVAVPLAFFAASRDKYVHAARTRIACLEDKLYENKATRREVMASMGERWKTNPSPSHDYAARRKMLERELDEALEGMNRTRRMDVGEVGGR